MDLIRWYLYSQLIGISLVSTFESFQLNLKQETISDEVTKIDCSVKVADKRLRIHLYCPGDVRCYEDCVKIPRHDQKTMRHCNTSENNNIFVVHYYLDLSSISTGEYYCTYKSEKSGRISLTQIFKPNTTIPPLTSTNQSSVSVPLHIKYIRFEYIHIILILGIFGVSVIINIAFIIQCCVVRNYLNKYPQMVRKSKVYSRFSWESCFCLKQEIESKDVYTNPKCNPYEKIPERPYSQISKSKSSMINDYLIRPMSQETEKLCLSSSTSQISRSSTFPARQSVIVHTPTDQVSLTAINGNDCFQPYMIQYSMDHQSKTMNPISSLNHRLSSQCIYDEVPGEQVIINTSTIPIRHFASTGSLQNRPRQLNSNLINSPLREESQMNILKLHGNTAEQELMINDSSSVLQDFSSSEEAYLSGKDNDSMHDPVRVAKLEMSREMMAKADTLLREAHNLLKLT